MTTCKVSDATGRQRLTNGVTVRRRSTYHDKERRTPNKIYLSYCPNRVRSKQIQEFGFKKR